MWDLVATQHVVRNKQRGASTVRNQIWCSVYCVLQTIAHERLLHWSQPKYFFSLWVCLSRKVVLGSGFLHPRGSWHFKTALGVFRTAVCSLQAVVPWGSLLFLRDWWKLAQNRKVSTLEAIFSSASKLQGAKSYHSRNSHGIKAWAWFKHWCLCMRLWPQQVSCLKQR